MSFCEEEEEEEGANFCRVIGHAATFCVEQGGEAPGRGGKWSHYPVITRGCWRCEVACFCGSVSASPLYF